MASETTPEMVRAMASELREIRQAMERSRGDAVAEATLTGCWMAHLLICSQAMAHNLLIDTARRPQRIET